MRGQYVDGPAEELLPFASLTITPGASRYSAPGAGWPCAASGLWAAGKPVQRPWVGLLGAVRELSELAAHHQQHRGDRDDRDPAQDPVDRAGRLLQPAACQVGYGRVDPGPDDAAGGVGGGG